MSMETFTLCKIVQIRSGIKRETHELNTKKHLCDTINIIFAKKGHLNPWIERRFDRITRRVTCQFRQDDS